MPIEKTQSRPRWAAWGVASVCCALMLGWQTLTVRYNYQGNWSGLFYTGSRAIPPELRDENIYQLSNDPGYDGQFYHFIAHDPLFDRSFDAYVDNPPLRWRRILVPGLAYLAAFGNDGAVDTAYRAVILLFVFLGTLWLAEFFADRGFLPAWGLAFPLIPGVVVSIDRMTVDVALAALTVGFVLYACRGAFWKLLPILVFAPLARETGLALVAGFALWLALRREWKRMAYTAATVIPWLAWAGFVRANTVPDQTSFLSIPFRGILIRTFHPIQYSLATHWLRMAAATDYLALMGIWVALVLAAVLAWQKRLGDPTAVAAACFAAGATLLGEAAIWNGAYEFARTLSPLLILLALAGVAMRRWWYLLPLALALPRLALQWQPQFKAVLHGLVHG